MELFCTKCGVGGYWNKSNEVKHFCDICGKKTKWIPRAEYLEKRRKQIAKEFS